MTISLSIPLVISWSVSLLLLCALLVVLILRKSNRHEQNSRDTGELQGRLNELEKISSHIDELRSLFILPRTRGDVGEKLLGELLHNWLPQDAFSLQYGFKDGTRADAVIFMDRYLVAIDAKFPFQSVREVLTQSTQEKKIPAQVRRTFIQHARSIAEKYIRPDQGTLQFALMYVPSETLYYNCFVEDSELSAAVLAEKVVPVGPANIFLYIQTIAYGLRGFNFPQEAEEVISRVAEVQQEMTAFDKEISTASTHLKNFTRLFDSLLVRYRKIDNLVRRIEQKK
ncbi:MAG TPA: DNA recombination protein RmuC [Clostridia bacterium]|nr:DNA recombination protein RmuC [Clostridia bacterium]